MSKGLREALEHKRIIVCVGAGGVGKTTMAAALALRACMLGRRALVVTIDPAKRLAQALGLDVLPGSPTPVSEAFLNDVASRLGAPARSSLQAMMLDAPTAWRDMLLRTSPSAEVARRIEQNRFYRILSSDLPGAHEFIACEQLFTLSERSDVDVLILDTPPTQNALDFLDAPQRILRMLDADFLRMMTTKLQGGGLFGGLFGSAAERVRDVLSMFTGRAMLDETIELMVALKDLYGPLTQRTEALLEFMASDDTSFVVVTAPDRRAAEEASFFAAELRQRRLGITAVIANRVVPSPDVATDQLQVASKLLAAQGQGQAAVDALEELLARQQRHHDAQREHLQQLNVHPNLLLVEQQHARLHNAAGFESLLRALDHADVPSTR
jgi:anion-transporting  ArsA/GET3 family ATPase